MASGALRVVRHVVDAVERPDLEALPGCHDPQVEIHEAGCLPYGGVYRSADGARRHAEALHRARVPHQPGAAARLGPTLVAGAGGTVVVLFTRGAVDRRCGRRCGRRLAESEVAGHRVRSGKVVRSQMLRADPTVLAGFLDHVRGGACR